MFSYTEHSEKLIHMPLPQNDFHSANILLHASHVPGTAIGTGDLTVKIRVKNSYPYGAYILAGLRKQA